jgi:hypothetical protein
MKQASATSGVGRLAFAGFMGRLVLLVSSLLSITAIASASSDVPPRLVWRAPPECIGAVELERAVSAELRRPAFSEGPGSEFLVRGSIERIPSGSYQAEVRLERVSGEAVGMRSLGSDNHDCRSLDEALAVMLAIMLNVSREEPAPPAPSRWSYRVALGGNATLGRMPGPGVELIAAGGPTLRKVLGFALEVGFEWGPEQDRDEGSVSARALAARLALSPLLLRGNPELALHLAGGGGALTATAAGFAAVSQETLGFAELRLGPRLSLRLARALFFEIVGDFGLMPVRPAFLVTNADGSEEELFRPSPWFGALGISFALRPP